MSSYMECDNKDHERFRNVFFATNGCLACELEKTSKERKRAELFVLSLTKAIEETWVNRAIGATSIDLHDYLNILRFARSLQDQLEENQIQT